MKAKDFANMPDSELTLRIGELREQIFKLRFKAVTEPVTDPSGLRNRRREIAVIKTVLRQKELGAEKRTAKLSREGRRIQRGRRRASQEKAATKAAPAPAPAAAAGSKE